MGAETTNKWQTTVYALFEFLNNFMINNAPQEDSLLSNGGTEVIENNYSNKEYN